MGHRNIHVPGFGEATRPLAQHSLRAPKGEPSQARWIVIAARDNDYDLMGVLADGGCPVATWDILANRSYDQLWSDLATCELDGRKWWLVGWRVGYAFDRADFTGALERGDVSLPTIKIGKNKGKHGGRLTYTNRVFEVDIIAGRNAIKAIDLANYGLHADECNASLQCVSINDVLTALKALFRLGAQSGLTIHRTTAAQLGWAHFREHKQRHALYVNHDPSSRALERRAYYGGRNEAFVLGDVKGTAHSLDVKSCYAAICRDEWLPARMIEEYKSGLPTSSILVAHRDHWIADVVIQTELADYPLTWQGQTIYPVGTFATSLCWPELQHALRHGRVMQITRAARYESDQVLRDYACWYLGTRAGLTESQDDVCRSALKSIFNSSLGYSARQKYEWVEWQSRLKGLYWFGSIMNPDTRGESTQAQALKDECRWLRISGEPYEAMPYLHATICSYARVRLLEIFDKAGRENILYCDTDGILCATAGREALESYPATLGDDCGQLVERFPSGSARIQGQKSYRIGRNHIQAGVVRTRFSKLVEKRVLTTTTGRVSTGGRVEPFRFVCEGVGDLAKKPVNILAGV